jgi:hypothetical protein
MDIVTIASGAQLEQQFYKLAHSRSARPILCELGGGVLAFAAAAFPALGQRIFLAKHFRREPKGRGAHFDVYGHLLDPYFPYIGVFNIAGEASLRTLLLPEGAAVDISTCTQNRRTLHMMQGGK